jgi:UDP:flavonoid glycosyltransferase YjiC (YdhE family)
MSETQARKKVFVLLPPATGHINPTTGILSELAKQNVDTYFYSTVQYKPLIEKCGAKFRQYPFSKFDKLHKKNVKELKNPVLELLTNLVEFSDKNMPTLLADVERDQPDLIIFDMLSMHAKYLFKILENRYKSGKLGFKPPKVMEISSMFAIEVGVSVTNEEFKDSFGRGDDNWFIFGFTWLIILQVIFSIKWGLRVWNTLDLFMWKPQNLACVLVTVVPELQPKYELFKNRKYKFVGSCISESVRNGVEVIKDERLREVMNRFEPVNPVKDARISREKEILIYVSLGTVFNTNMFVFEAIFEAIQKLKIYTSDIKVVVSTGGDMYTQNRDKFNKLPDNFIVCPSVPQIEVLKRATLFVTHCGMNSCSEAIHYAVPVVCVPLNGDQPINAKRLTELGLGLKLDALNLKVDELRDAIETVLSDAEFSRRIVEFSKVSRSYNGNLNGCQVVMEVLNNCGSKKTN